MKDYIINNDGKVRICDSNIAKMNIFEWMYYRRIEPLYQIKFILNQLKEGFTLISAALINLLIIPLYPIIGILAIIKAKKEVERCNARKNN